MHRSVALGFTLVTCLLTVEGQAAAAPLVLPHPSFRPGKAAGLQVAAPAGSMACNVTMRGSRGPVLRHRVSLGGPTRLLRWRIGGSARGTWHVDFGCVGIRRQSLGVARSRIVVRRGGRPHGRLVVARTVQVTHGSIPEMPHAGPLHASGNPLIKNDVSINHCAGATIGCFNPCSKSEEISSTRTTGDGFGTVAQVEPSRRARLNAAANFASLSTSDQALREDYVLYRTMWSDLNRCANLPTNLSAAQRHSLYEQMACHALYGVSSRFGGNTWDFEAWRKNVDWATALSYQGQCQRYGDVPDAAAALQGKLVKAFDTRSSALLPATWLVSNLNGLSLRRNIATAHGYGCLIHSGYQAPHWYPAEFLDEYLPSQGPAVTDDEACGRSTATDGGATRIKAYDNYRSGAAGHAMCRGNPARPESMPGGTATQTFTVPSNVAAIDAALVQIDPDASVTAHAQLIVNGSVRATADAAAAGDTTFSFGSVVVKPGDQVTLSLSFSATYGKLITVYTVGSPGGVFTASNSCSDGAPSFTASAGLRAVVSGWSD